MCATVSATSHILETYATANTTSHILETSATVLLWTCFTDTKNSVNDARLLMTM